ncbi:MAG: hypothetical protein A2939_01345 [Parcubacteria group bacterium RIFCSPLOWO2_01_FULL_48_18]|nr:MAG: hypothetical protein A2939_01345 [Parcubacteria group bacterium RIFCSPLOWO2_01_FULL_48_18]OHB23871.1 MAG: hypothetical protein A3J67_03250 [Parcubacteria group bacterium RIFCSPHIGHO2_02_FULL_48_10b]
MGESICTDEYLKEYIKYGRKNNPEEVTKLQEFLNNYMGEALPLTGFYGQLTREAVNRFQVRYSDEVLVPWLPYGLQSATTPTGYVYKTTKRWINMLVCSVLNLPIPPLP